MNMDNNYSEIVDTAKKAFSREVTKPLDFRIKQLKALYQLLEDNGEEIIAAVQKDIRKSYTEALLAEVEGTKNEIKGALRGIRKWVQPEKPNVSLIFILDRLFIFPQPYGVVLIIGAWNYPFCLVAIPLIGAIAAGNCAIIKPSEKSPATAQLIADLVPRYLDKECYHVVTGGVPETTSLLKERFDYIFYTGSPGIGQKIREASNKFLTPVTLELGGKSPVYVHDEVDMDLAVKRILWGKMLNCGQVCVAPDYVLCSKSTEAKFIEIAKKVLLEFFGKEPQKSPDYARIVNEQHFQRVRKFLDCGKVAIGGACDPKDNYIAPTVLVDVTPSDSVMQEEIFGPVLPIITVNSPEEAITFINEREKPLTLYLFTTNQDVINKFLTSTSSGNMCVNDTMMNLSVDTLPFGGVGMSGMGSYRGKFTFDTFSHKRAVVIRTFNTIGEYLAKVRYPPFISSNLPRMKRFLRMRPIVISPILLHLMIFCLGMITAFVVMKVFTVAVNGYNSKHFDEL